MKYGAMLALPFVLLLLPGSAGLDDAHRSLAAEAGSHGSALLQQGKGEEAERAFLLAARLQPSLWQAHYSLGSTLLSLCRYAGALVAYSRALAELRTHGSATHQAAVLRALATGAILRVAVCKTSNRPDLADFLRQIPVVDAFLCTAHGTAHTHIHIHTHAHTHTHKTHVHPYSWIHKRRHERLPVANVVSTPLPTYTQTRTHAHTPTHTHTYLHI